MYEGWKDLSVRDMTIFYSYRNFKPVELFDDGKDVMLFGGLNDNTDKSILISLQAVYFGLSV